jgi:DNA polymerase I-like protein with 3'-5' exonuclease and polymerase domains
VNVQNIPRDDKIVKGAFWPKLDAFLFFDYPNIEAKLLAYYLDAIGHPEMAAAFRGDGVPRLGLPAGVELDMHILTAAGVYNVSYEELLTRFLEEEKQADLWRQVGKRLNFSIIYGGGVPTLIEQGVAKDGKEAIDLLRRYHATWPGIGWESMKKDAPPGTLNYTIKKTLRQRGYITTLWGRHLHPSSMHKALNHLCQGCAADLMKTALVRVHRYTVENELQSHLVNVVHDELMLDSVKEEIDRLVADVPDLMTDERVDKVVPIRPGPDISFTTWAEKAPYRIAA